MKLAAIRGDDEHSLEIKEEDRNTYSVTVDGEGHEVDATHLEGHTWSVLLDGHSYDVDVHPDPRDPDTLHVRVRGQTFEMTLLDERRLRMRQVSGGFGVEGRAVVEAPMPGKVTRILVAVGDQVDEGQGVVVVEAMKMENELRAPKAGEVAEVSVAEGDLVEGGTALVTID